MGQTGCMPKRLIELSLTERTITALLMLPELLTVSSGLSFALCPPQMYHHVSVQLSWRVTQQPVTI